MLFRSLLEKDADENVRHGNATLVECADCVAYNADPGGDGGHAPVLVGFGLKDLVLVQTRDAVLVLPRDHVQRVKDVVAHLRAQGREEYL